MGAGAASREWACVFCTLVNPGSYLACDVCGAERPSPGLCGFRSVNMKAESCPLGVCSSGIGLARICHVAWWNEASSPDSNVACACLVHAQDGFPFPCHI